MRKLSVLLFLFIIFGFKVEASVVTMNLATIPGVSTNSSVVFQQTGSFILGGPTTTIGAPITATPVNGKIFQALGGGGYSIYVGAYAAGIQVPSDSSTNDYTLLVTNKLATTLISRQILQQPTVSGIQSLLFSNVYSVLAFQPISQELAHSQLYTQSDGSSNIQNIAVTPGYGYQLTFVSPNDHLMSNGAVTFNNSTNFVAVTNYVTFVGPPIIVAGPWLISSFLQLYSTNVSGNFNGNIVGVPTNIANIPVVSQVMTGQTNDAYGVTSNGVVIAGISYAGFFRSGTNSSILKAAYAEHNNPSNGMYFLNTSNGVGFSVAGTNLLSLSNGVAKFNGTVATNGFGSVVQALIVAGTGVTTSVGTGGAVTINSSGGGGAPTGSASGDLNGNYPGPGVATVGGSSAANVHGAELLANAATTATTASTIVKRDSLGTIAGQIHNGGSATNLTILSSAIYHTNVWTPGLMTFNATNLNDWMKIIDTANQFTNILVGSYIRNGPSQEYTVTAITNSNTTVQVWPPIVATVTTNAVFTLSAPGLAVYDNVPRQVGAWADGGLLVLMGTSFANKTGILFDDDIDSTLLQDHTGSGGEPNYWSVSVGVERTGSQGGDQLKIESGAQYDDLLIQANDDIGIRGGFTNLFGGNIPFRSAIAATSVGTSNLNLGAFAPVPYTTATITVTAFQDYGTVTDASGTNFPKLNVGDFIVITGYGSEQIVGLTNATKAVVFDNFPITGVTGAAFTIQPASLVATNTSIIGASIRTSPNLQLGYQSPTFNSHSSGTYWYDGETSASITKSTGAGAGLYLSIGYPVGGAIGDQFVIFTGSHYSALTVNANSLVGVYDGFTNNFNTPLNFYNDASFKTNVFASTVTSTNPYVGSGALLTNLNASNLVHQIWFKTNLISGLTSYVNTNAGAICVEGDAYCYVLTTAGIGELDFRQAGFMTNILNALVDGSANQPLPLTNIIHFSIWVGPGQGYILTNVSTGTGVGMATNCWIHN